eukprot:6601411-Prymnesium_polylepis.1
MSDADANILHVVVVAVLLAVFLLQDAAVEALAWRVRFPHAPKGVLAHPAAQRQWQPTIVRLPLLLRGWGQRRSFASM